MAESVKARLHVTDALSAGGSVMLPDDQAHYLRHVLRLQPGEAVALFNGRDGEFRAVIAEAGKKGVRLDLAAQLRPQPASTADVWLCFAPIKQGRIEMIVEKATELDAGRLLPVITRRTQMQKVNAERLAAHAREAAEQCERLDVPEVAPAVTLEKLLQDWPQDRQLFLCAERSDAPSLLAAAKGRGPCALLVGPEGGFAPEELDRLAALSQVVTVSLGPRILRAETAAIAALAILQSVRQN
ncbi:16S rRNA (uracil(1498)-N(3))-methyltransferase [Ferrovibrio terrae]|uniref:Ribosomal RNA small subunit methyltransferase E n=2 Tax=Ferrovibrio terrae TaxID=2594003 RepID=A0A516H2H2_9PROT|nr:16S rRNA (uracil(1498)-N(3))-methyltransferase [Ferrovibrio terrae]QDO97974.1 16S rRNA (uracil(1498)-N(3))-methyltransferase [Ferrovibrio terrae]